MKSNIISPAPHAPAEDADYRRTLSGLYLPKSEAVAAPMIVEPPRPKILIPETAVISAYAAPTEVTPSEKPQELQLDSLTQETLIIR